MSKLTFIQNYNNYFNRIIKVDSTFTGYTTKTFTGMNFNPNDDVTTEHIINWSESWMPDYVLVYTDNDVLVSRWFITEAVRTRQLQYKFSLKRDLIADYYNKVINAPMIVERGMVTNTVSPLLYNPEGFSFNQIKKDEILLKDKIGTPWYVLYFTKDHGTLTGTYTRTGVNYDKKISESIASSIYSAGTKKYVDDLTVTLKYRTDASDFAWLYSSNLYDMQITKNGFNHIYNSFTSTASTIWFNNSFDTCRSQLNTAFTGTYNTLKADVLIDTSNTSVLTEAQYNELVNIGSNGITVLDSDNKLYRVTVYKASESREGKLTTGTTKTFVEGIINSTTLDRSDHFGDNTLNYSYSDVTLTVAIDELEQGTVTWTLWDSNDNKQNTLDSDFDIIAVPYDDITFSSAVPYTTSSIDAKLFIDSVAQVASSKLVDIQLLPYCPLQEAYNPDPTVKRLDVRRIPASCSQRIEGNPGTPQSYTSTLVLYVPSSNFTFNIEQQLTVPSILGRSDVISYKVDNECSLYKIVSPNFNGSFEFSVAKNQGVDYFNVDVTLIPYNPYIHINPNFKGLYGQDFNDARGLICGGDFSLPRYTDKFAEYELNNKNYQLIFDRQIRNLDVKQKQERIQTYVGLGVGAVTGAGAGAAAGAMTGAGPVGAVVGGMVGGVSSLAGGIADAALLNERQAEERSFAMDNWTYQLGNIKALPDTINKVTPLTYNNKIYPFIEIYTATDEEKSLFANYLAWRSMNVNVIGNISNFIQTDKYFIKGNIIRLEDLGLASHEAYEIYKEIKEGVYI